MIDRTRAPASPAQVSGGTGAVLVAGATGFIGREIVRRLLAEGRRVIALARARGGQPGVARVASAVRPPAGARLEVVEGEFGAPGSGLGATTRSWLRETVETIINCAGDTSFVPRSMASFRAGHVEGPRELVEQLQGGRLRRVGHLSTAFVCGNRSGVVLESERDVGQGFHNPYERVKLEAETSMRDTGRQLGVDVRVLRPSIVVGQAPGTSGGGPSQLLFGLIRLAAAVAQAVDGAEVAVRVPMAPDARFNIVPLEYVAAAVVLLVEHPEGAGETFHLVARDAPTNREMLAMITARLGLRGISLVDPRGGALDEPSPLEARIERMLAGYRDYLAQDVRFDDANARRLLDSCGLPRPEWSAAAFDRLIAEALETRILEAPADV
jgi:thioester reductase-like protein